MANISLTLYTNGFFGSVLKSPIQIGTFSVNNSVTIISRSWAPSIEPKVLALSLSPQSMKMPSTKFTVKSNFAQTSGLVSTSLFAV
jgi:hypothetical protein